ncbi:putative late embryogenesis abundant protein, partial [Trifolium medium]|nr:putative late embryogenesis abundant protein [Trifolium medium]
SDKASNIAQNAKDSMGDAVGYGREGAANVYDQGKQKLNTASDVASEKFYDVKDTMENEKDKARNAYAEFVQKIRCGGHKADETFERLKREVHEAYMAARKSMNEDAKANYEGAKEKASEATGNLGAKMRNTP